MRLPPPTIAAPSLNPFSSLLQNKSQCSLFTATPNVYFHPSHQTSSPQNHPQWLTISEHRSWQVRTWISHLYFSASCFWIKSTKKLWRFFCHSKKIRPWFILHTLVSWVHKFLCVHLTLIFIVCFWASKIFHVRSAGQWHTPSHHALKWTLPFSPAQIQPHWNLQATCQDLQPLTQIHIVEKKLPPLLSAGNPAMDLTLELVPDSVADFCTSALSVVVLIPFPYAQCLRLQIKKINK